MFRSLYGSDFLACKVSDFKLFCNVDAKIFPVFPAPLCSWFSGCGIGGYCPVTLFLFPLASDYLARWFSLWFNAIVSLVVTLVTIRLSFWWLIIPITFPWILAHHSMRPSSFQTPFEKASRIVVPAGYLADVSALPPQPRVQNIEFFIRKAFNLPGELCFDLFSHSCSWGDAIH